ncbi:MAG: glycoside hydrolase family 9 protein [Lachnospiraceae bacterium]|nr:glycoside hydrolase family 9 protein [Lachnospiraceae bacterium]
MKHYLEKRENRITLAFFLITMIVAMAPLVSRYCINGHDIEYHLLRIESLKEGIRIGRPFLKVNTLFYGGAGYASSLFYSDILLHIPALLRVFHVSIGKSFHIYTAMIFVMCYLSTFYCVWKMSLSKFAGTIAAILLTLCPYHMDDMLVRTACGETAAFIFLPFAIYGIFNVIHEDMDKPWVFGFGFAGLILAHPATCILTVAFGIVCFLIHIKKFINTPRLFAKLCVVSGLAVLVTAFHWVPMLEQFASAKFYVSDNWSDLLDAAVGFSDIASTTFPCVGFVLFALILPRFFMSRKDYPILGFVDMLIVAAIIFAVGATNIMPWERVARFFGFLQFPWRMFIMTSTLLAMADAIVLRLFLDRADQESRSFTVELTLIVVMAAVSFLAVNHQNENSMGYYDYSDDYYSYKPFTANVIAGEWLPQTVKEPQKLVDQSEHMIYDDRTECSFTRDRAKITAEIKGGHEYVDVPFIYYKGYRAVITDKDGVKTKLEVTGEGQNGLCRVQLNGSSGTLTVTYAGTIIQYVSWGISILFLILIFDLVYLKSKYKKKLKMRAAAAGANLGKIAGVLLCLFISSSLSACSVAGAQAAAGYTDPDAMIDYLNYRNGTGDDGFDQEAEDLTKVNLSHKGYDADAGGYAIEIDESSGEQVISVLSLDDAAAVLGEEIPVTKDLYKTLLEEEISSVRDKYRTGSLKDRVMYETDALLCLEVFPEKAKIYGINRLATELGSDIMNIPEDEISDMLDRYNCAAVLAKAAYVMPEWDMAEKAAEDAEDMFREAESMTDDADPVASRLWSAAELYRLTGSKTYRSVVDAIAMDVITEGFSYEEPGFYGLFAYLMSPNPTNYNICTSIMNVVFDESNALIKQPVETEFFDKRVDDDTRENDEKTALRMMSEAYLVTMTNYVSVSVEYRDFVVNRLNYIYGANLSGIDLTDEDEVLCDLPRLFVLTGLT